jgi:holo-[acyl-carrier protein] synthase
MAIYGIGSDILNRTRIERTYATFGERFLFKIFTPQEQEAYASCLDVVDKLAKSFAAKEAFSKAYGTGIGKEIGFKDISVLRKNSGQPYFVIHKDLPVTAHLSFCDEGEIIMAFVVLEHL